jgi:hypothetical protein
LLKAIAAGAALELDMLELERGALEELATVEDEDSISELDDISSTELDDTVSEDETDIFTTKVMYSLSVASVISDREISISEPLQNINWSKSVTFPDPGKASLALAYLSVSGMASSISTYMWLPSLLTVFSFQTDAT